MGVCASVEKEPEPVAIPPDEIGLLNNSSVIRFISIIRNCRQGGFWESIKSQA